MKIFTTLLGLSFLTLAQLPLASAATFPGSNIDNIETYLDAYSNGYTELNAIDFSNQWQYTAIAYESGNINTVSMTTGTPDSTTFSTASHSNFGEWKSIDFSSGQLFFEDSDGPINIELDPFSSANDAYFRVFELSAATTLSYLNDLTLSVGTIIIGFNDNGLGLGDADYDDIIVALKPISAVPIPAAAFLFAPALLGFMGLRRKAKNSIA